MWVKITFCIGVILTAQPRGIVQHVYAEHRLIKDIYPFELKILGTNYGGISIQRSQRHS